MICQMSAKPDVKGTVVMTYAGLANLEDNRTGTHHARLGRHADRLLARFRLRQAEILHALDRAV